MSKYCIKFGYIDTLTVMAPGECIVSGTAFQMPAFIRISQVSPETRPRSENVVLVGDNGLFNHEKVKKETTQQNCFDLREKKSHGLFTTLKNHGIISVRKNLMECKYA